MDTSKKYVEMCEKAEEVQNYFRQKVEEMNKKKYCGTLIGNPVDLRSQGYCLKHKCLLGEGIEGDIRCYKHKDCDDYGGWSQNYILLFRQDQLQKMVFPFPPDEEQRIDNMYFELIAFEYWKEKQNHTFGAKDLKYKFGSMEQIWLGYVMKEKYQKEWNGKNWVSCQIAQEEV